MSLSPEHSPTMSSAPEKMPPADGELSCDALPLPDLSAAEPGEYERTTTVATELHLRGNAYPCTLTFERFEESQSTRHQKMQLHLTVFDPTTHEQIATFKGALNDEKDPSSHRKNHCVYWRIFTRRVDKSTRGSGLGSACLRAYEHQCRRIAAEYPSLKAEWISVNTMLTSLTRLLISQEWLKTHRLSEFSRSSGEDFGYIPRPEDEEYVPIVLRAGTEELNDAVERRAPQIELRKIL